MKDLVFVLDNQVVVSSRKVAEVFKREHKDVIASIKNIVKAEISALSFYEKRTYKVVGQYRRYPEYIMGRDGFMLLVMGFNTKDAIKLKAMFIRAFNDMEAKLKAKALTNTPAIEEHKRTIQQLVSENYKLKKKWEDATTFIKLGLIVYWTARDENKAALTHAFITGLNSND